MKGKVSGARRKLGRFTGRDERAGLGRAHRLARPGLGEYDMPKIVPGLREPDADHPPLVLFANRGDKALDGFLGHFVKNAHGLPGKQRGVHDDQRAVSAYELCGGLQVNSFAFRHLATNAKRNLERYPYRSTAFGISGAVHGPGLEGTRRESVPRFGGMYKRQRGGNRVYLSIQRSSLRVL